MAIDTTNIIYIDYLWTKKNSDGTLSGIRLNKLNLPTNTAFKDINNNFSAPQYFLSPANASGTEQSSVVVYTSNGGSIRLGKEGPNSGSMIRLDQKDGTCRLRFRSSSTAGAMVWEQPESNSALYLDVSNVFFRQTSTVNFNNYKTADYLYTNSSGNLQKGTFKTLTIQKNGTNVATFKGNSNNTTANIEINTIDVNNTGTNITGNTVNDVFENAKEIKSSDGSINISLVDGYIDFVVASAPVTITLNGNSTTNPSFYAPISGGTSGYLLKSNGKYAPGWISASSLTVGTANKVANSLKITANGGTAEGTTQYTFNGSAAKTINFRPSNDAFKVYGSKDSIFIGSQYIYLTSGNALRDYISIDAPNATYSMQIGDYGFTVDSGSPAEGNPSNIFSVNTDKMFYNGTETQITSLANSDYIAANSDGILESGTAREITAGDGININLVSGNVEISRTETPLTVTSSGSGNAITSISVSGHNITATKGKTFLTNVNHPVTKGNISANRSHSFSYAGGQPFYIIYPTKDTTYIKATIGTTKYTCYNFVTVRAYAGGRILFGYMDSTTGNFKNIALSQSSITFDTEMRYIYF